MAEFSENKKGEKIVTYAEGTKTYVPSKKEYALLMVMCDPESYGMTIVERCEKIGISATWYWALMTKTEIQEMLHEICITSIKEKKGAFIQKWYDFAVTEKSCSADRKEIAKIMGFELDKKEININKRNMNVNVDVTTATTEDLLGMIKNMIKEDPSLIPPKVLKQLTTSDDDDDDLLETEEYEIEDDTEE